MTDRPPTMPPALPIIEMSRRYCESHRRYHTIEHIAKMLWVGRTHALTDEQVAAIWYHDAIYDPHREDNEARSAELASAQLSALGWPPNSVGLVCQMVLDTRTHVPTCDPSRTVIDLDLYSLAEEREIFERDGRRIRAEYAHIGDDEFHEGRRRFFLELLARDRLYWTSWGARLEETARLNLRRALRDL